MKTNTKGKQLLVSVITPAHNEEADIADAIESILRQTYQNFEIIVINDGSTDRTREIAEKFAKRDKRIRVLNYEKGHSAAFARNRGIEKARGEIITFHDADEVADDRYLEMLVKHFVDDASVDAVANKVLAYPPKTFIAKCIAAQRSVTWDTNQAEPTIIYRGTPIGIGTYRTSVFRKLGAFREGIFYFEDTDLVERFHRGGHKGVYEPAAIEFHKDPSTLGETLRQSRWFGKGIGLQLRATLDPRPLLIPHYCLLLVLSLAAALAFPGAKIAFGLLLIPWVAYGLKLSLKSGDPLHSFGFMFLFVLRNLVKLYHAKKAFLFG